MNNNRCSVLTYHDLTAKNNPQHSIYAISKQSLREHFVYLQKNNYEIISFYELMKHFESGEKLPSKCAILTFDGPYVSWKNVVLPLLLEFKYKATFFVITSWLNNNHCGVTWADLKDIRDYRLDNGEQQFNFESHSCSHSLLIKQPFENQEQYLIRLSEEIGGSKEILESKLEQKVGFFALPFGRGNNLTIINLAKRYGYHGIRTCHTNNVFFNKPDLYDMPSEYIAARIYPRSLFALCLRRKEKGCFFNLGVYLLIKLFNVLYRLRLKK